MSWKNHTVLDSTPCKIKYNNQVVSFQFRKFGIAFSRKTCLGFLVFTILIMIIIAKLFTFEVDDPVPSEIKKISWKEFQDECGPAAYFIDPIKSIEKFNYKYLGVGTYWNGTVVKIFDHLSYSNHFSVYINTKLDEDQSDSNESVLLIFSKSLFNKYKQVFLNISVGSRIQFCGIFIRSSGKIPINLFGFSIEILPGINPIKKIVDPAGRYANYTFN